MLLLKKVLSITILKKTIEFGKPPWEKMGEIPLSERFVCVGRETQFLKNEEINLRKFYGDKIK